MAFDRFRARAAIRIGVFALTVGLFFWLLFRTRLYAATALAGLAIAVEIAGLFRTVDKTNQDLARFFESVRFGDFTQSFRDRRSGRSFGRLHAAMAEVMDAFRKARAEKEEQALYLRTLVQHVGIGLLVFRPDGSVDLINTAAKRLLKIPHLKTLAALEGRHPGLAAALLKLRPRERALVRVESGDEQLQLSLFATEFKLGGGAYTLVSIQDIRGELEEKEIDAWQKLIRVLTHEILNSMTPISSLASTIQDLLGRTGTAPGDAESSADIRQAVETIRKRSEGLIHFIEGYRSLTRIPPPSFQLFPAAALFERVERLLQAQAGTTGARLAVSVDPETLELLADPDLLEQVLINLVRNAVDAVAGRPDPRIELAAFLDDRGRAVLQVRDNGTGIPAENLDKIFVPFFSTKPEGSGIGLSLSRQIMRLHDGSISAASRPGGETVFTLRFNL